MSTGHRRDHRRFGRGLDAARPHRAVGLATRRTARDAQLLADDLGPVLGADAAQALRPWELVMTGPVLVGLDACGLDSGALVWAVEWCLQTGDEMVVVSALDPDQAEMALPWHDEMVEAAHHDVEGRVGELENIRRVKHRSRIVDGDPSEVITATADEEGVSLIVVGARGSGGFRGLGLGGVAHHLAHHVHRPLIVVPEIGGAVAGGTIVVGVDGSDGSAAALAWAVEAARLVGGSVNAVFAFDPSTDGQRHGNVTNLRYRGEEEALAQVEEFDTGDIVVKTTLVGEHPVEALTKVGADNDACLIAVGTRGGGLFGGMVLGRVPAQLPHHAGRPVALIHRDVPPA